MLGLMQQWPLLCHKILDNAAIQHGKREIVSRSCEGPIVRSNYAELRQRSLKVAQRLARDGFKLGDRIATLAWNTARHLEAWYGTMGIGAVYHTPVSRTDRLDHEPRGRPGDFRRPHLHATG